MKKTALGCVAATMLLQGAALQGQHLELVCGGFTKPLEFVPDPLDNSRFYVLEQGGVIKIVEGSTVLPEPFFTVNKADFNDQENERGLLGMAFDPDYATNKRFYLNYTAKNGATHVSRFTASDSHHAEHGTEEVLLVVDQPYWNHNGGCIRFGPDKMLYIGMGDGGSGGDPHNNSQRMDTLLGKMVRIDVCGTPDAGLKYAIPKDNPFVGKEGILPEIWASGLRNPWRFAFDSKGRIWIGDVGQNRTEEVSLQPEGSKGGENYGWRVMEGSDPFGKRRKPTDPAPDATLVPPIWSYNKTPASITGGFFYEAEKVPSLKNRYIVADYVTGQVWSFKEKNGAADDIVEHTSDFASAFGPFGAMLSISSFGQDNDGELYVIDHREGRLFKIVK